MDLYLIVRKGSPIERDEVAGFVIAAVTYPQARKIAAANSQDEGKAVWLDAERSTCEKLATNAGRPSGVILADVLEG